MLLGNLLDDLLRRGVRALQAAGAEFVLIGGVAMVASGRERNTRDMDVVVREIPAQLDQACQREGFQHDPERDRFQLEGLRLHRYWAPIGETGLRWSLDVQQADSPYHQGLLARAKRVRLGDLELPLAPPADLILLKLLAFRPVDRADCLNLVQLYPDLDREYVETWVERLGVRARWEEVLALAAEDL